MILDRIIKILKVQLNHTEKTVGTNKVLSVCIILLTVISLVPLILISKYNHPCADDFCYGFLTAETWANTGSFIETVKSAFAQVQYFYQIWQGTYSAIFLMSLQPAIFGEGYYFLGTIVILGTYLFGFLLLSQVVFKNYLNADFFKYTIIYLPVIVFSIQLVPFPASSYYWFNGSVFYTFFFGLGLVFLAFILKFIRAGKGKSATFYLLVSMMLAAIIGGGNYVTVLQMLILIFTLIIYRITTKKDKIVPLIMVELILLVSIIISAMAPGTAVRQALFPDHPSAFMAILKSIKAALWGIFMWTDLYVMSLCLFSLPFIIQIVQKTKFSYKHPFLVLIYTFCILAANFTPSIYATGSFPERLFDIIYYSYYLFLFFNLFYIVGWLVRYSEKSGVAYENKLLRAFPAILCVCVFLFFAAFVQSPHIAAIEATKSLVNDEAAKYDREANERLVLYMDDSQKKVVVDAFSVKPLLLYFTDITMYADDWKNQAVAKYYKKQTVALKNDSHPLAKE